MSRRLFGTDGIRARFGEEPLVEPTVRRFGAALGSMLTGAPAHRPTAGPHVLVGGDTRASTPQLARWAAEGLAASGARVTDLGTIPTGGVALLVPRLGAACGLVVSASHNPAEDNGLKLIGADGFKWSTAAESELEARLAQTPELAPRGSTSVDGAALVEEYVSALAALARTGGERPLAGLRVALDCAHGAASRVAAPLFARLGAEVATLFAAPDGANINRGCGSTHPAALAAHVAQAPADEQIDLGFAFDGDADRVLLVDAKGEVRDGDAMLYLWAIDLAEQGELDPAAIVATSMSNLGLERALARRAIAVVRCDVGDRAVVESLKSRGLRLGGEQSGHIVDLRRSTTGDGLLSAVVLAALVARSRKPAHELLADFRRYPQLLINVRVREKPDLLSLSAVARAARAVTARLGADGRLVLRYSGTEPLARIMLEGPDQATIRAHADELAAAIRSAIGE